MSLGSKKGRFRASATWWAWPFWNFLIKEFQGSAAPSNSNLGFQVEWRTLAECLASLLSTKDPHVLSLVIFCYFRSFGRAISPSSVSFYFLFFLCKIGLGSRSNGEGGRGGGRLGGSWVFGAFLDDDPLLLPARRSFRPFLRFKDISSSSLEMLSTWAIISLEEWATEDLSSSPLESESSTGLSCASPSYSRRKWSISAFRNRCEEVVSSFEATNSRGEWWKGSSTSGRSPRAKKSSFETSIRVSLGSPALMALPMYWNIVDKGLKSSMRWTARNYLSSLTNTSNLSTLLRLAKLTRLRLGHTYLLSAKTSELQEHG